jgi:hypothetical protein
MAPPGRAGRTVTEDGVDVGTVRSLATPERAVRVIGGLIGDTVTFGPVPCGPHDMATASATGAVGRVSARRDGDLRVEVRVPVSLDVTVVIGTRHIPADVELLVRVGLVARPVPDAVEIDVEPVRHEDIDADIRTSGVGGVFLRRLGDLDTEIRHHVGVYVSAVLATPEAVAECRIPV